MGSICVTVPGRSGQGRDDPGLPTGGTPGKGTAQVDDYWLDITGEYCAIQTPFYEIQVLE